MTVVHSHSSRARVALRSPLDRHRAFTHAALWLAASLLGALCLPAYSARLALVVGNDQYANVKELKNARNDARLMAQTLQAAGFELVGGLRENLAGKPLWRAIDQLKQRIVKGDEVVFYFAGHGVQIGGNPVLLPTDIEADNEDQIERDGVRLYELQDKFKDARFALLVIDACRDNPFPPKPGRTRSLGDTRGLAPPTEAVDGMAILMAASRGQRALDSVPGVTTANGLFTYELVQALKNPGLDVVSALREVRDRVEDKAKGARHTQRPALVDETRGKFYLFAAAPVARPGVTPAVDLRQTPVQVLTPTPALRPGQVVKDCAECPELVVIPEGEFVMGSPDSEPGRHDDEGPQRRVRVGAFLAGKYEVTFGEWEACVSAGGCNQRPEDQGWGRGRRPVINVSWNDAQGYVQWLSGRTGKAYRLLSEAEWEYVARAGTTTPFWTGQTISAIRANFDGSQGYNGSDPGENRQNTAAVGSFDANAFGLHDTAGNVWEWTQDVWHDEYIAAPSDGSAWLAGGDQARRVLRGGAWSTIMWHLRSANRNWDRPDIRDSVTGFRIARPL